MRLRQLEAFRATMISGTVSGAAEILQISQPAVSRLIEKFEGNFNITLFDRSTGRLVPTPEAQLLYEEVERAFSSIDKIRHAAFDIQSGKRGQLDLACLPALGLGFVPSVIGTFATEYPDVYIRHEIQISAKVEEWAASQQVDFGLAEFPFHRSGFVMEDFCRTPYLLAVPSHYEVAKLDVVTPRDLVDVPMIVLTKACAGRHRIDQAFQAAGVSYRIVYETPLTNAISSLVAKGLGVGLIDPFTAYDFRDHPIVVRPFEPTIIFHVGVLYPGHRPLSKVASRFLAALRAARKPIIGPMPDAEPTDTL